MLTIKIKYTLNSEDDEELLDRYIRLYNNVYRVAFNRMLKGLKNNLNDLSKLNNIYLLDTWVYIVCEL